MTFGYALTDWVSAEYGPFSTTDALHDFICERLYELQEAYTEWCRQEVEAESLEIEKD